MTAGTGCTYLLGQLLGGQHNQGADLAHDSWQQGLRGSTRVSRVGPLPTDPACRVVSSLTCTTGMTKASVFPLPVGAETQRSLGR